MLFICLCKSSLFYMFFFLLLNLLCSSISMELCTIVFMDFLSSVFIIYIYKKRFDAFRRTRSIILVISIEQDFLLQMTFQVINRFLFSRTFFIYSNPFVHFRLWAVSLTPQSSIFLPLAWASNVTNFLCESPTIQPCCSR